MRKALGAVGEFVAAGAAMATIGFLLWGFYLNLKIVADIGGFWATIAGGPLFPLVVLVTPWYAGFVLGDWFPFWISYTAFFGAACVAALGARLYLKMAPQASLPVAVAESNSAGKNPSDEPPQPSRS